MQKTNSCNSTTLNINIPTFKTYRTCRLLTGPLMSFATLTECGVNTVSTTDDAITDGTTPGRPPRHVRSADSLSQRSEAACSHVPKTERLRSVPLLLAQIRRCSKRPRARYTLLKVGVLRSVILFK